MNSSLSDGTDLDTLRDDEAYSLSARLFHDPEIFRLEQDRIFARAWIAVAHESEIPDAGDYVTRRTGLDRVIVTRDQAGQIRVLLNSCAHRGTQLCPADRGNARVHVCRYHGWAFHSDGTLAGVPNEQDVYGRRLPREAYGLRQARVERFGGWIFACWSEDAPTLDDYLGDHRWYLEMLFCRTDRGLEVLAPPQRFIIETNWKLLAENFAADHGHIGTTHGSLGHVGLLPDPPSHHSTTASCNGHSMLHNPESGHEPVPGTPLDDLRAFPPGGMPPELVDQLPKHLSEDQIRVMSSCHPTTGLVFPNMAKVLFSPFPAGDELGSVFTVRLFAPLSPDKTEVFSFAVAEADADDHFKRLVARATNAAFSPSGMFEADDIVNWNGMQRGLSGAVTGRRTHLYPAVREPDPEGWPGPGEVHQGPWTDSPQWNMYLRYFDLMTGRA